MKRLTIEDVEQEIAYLDDLDIKSLQARWRELYGIAPPKRVRSGFLRRAIAHRLQELVHGGLKPASARALKKIAAADRDTRAGNAIATSGGADAGLRNAMPRKRFTLSPGLQLVREWNGKAETVDVIQDGYVWRGQTFKTLSAVANAITGSRWSGPRFFGLLAKRKTSALSDRQSGSTTPDESITFAAPTDRESA